MSRPPSWGAVPATALAILLACGCTTSPATGPAGGTGSGPATGTGAAAPGAGRRLASVNGVAVTVADVDLVARSGGHESSVPAADKRKDVLETVIRDELAAQRAMALGLDAEPAYREELARLEAQVSAFKRKRLAELLYGKALAAETKATDAEAKDYFDRNAVHIRSEFHVWQILKRDEASITAARAEMAAGSPFEEVARRLFPKLPAEAGTPWDLGWLRWTQLPEPWRDVVDGLAIGVPSDVIRGPSSRFWIIRILERRENPAVTFETEKAALLDALGAEKREKLRVETDRALRAAATIVYDAPPPPGAPSPSTPPAEP